MNRENDMTDSRYTPELAAEICKRVSEGSPLRQVCRDDDIPVSESSVRQWVRDDRNGFAPQYSQARSMQIDCWADEILTVAYREDLDPADKRVITENLRWLLSKLAPTRYGDRLLLAGDPANPIQLLHWQASVDVLSADALEALEAFCTSVLIESGHSQLLLPGASRDL
jgi:hypothetical protein